MDDIKDIVTSIVKGCKLGGSEVSDVLAAFVARTIVEQSTSTFALDKPVTPERREQIVLESIEKLLERDNPSLETLKMQVEYDSSFLKEDIEAQRVLRLRNKMIATHKMGITDVEMEDANDFESLTILYRKIFKFLLDYPPNAKLNDRLVEREVAAALESVFPRIGLKAFLGLNKDERGAQLMELARITLGIRLFNREQARGGAGIDSMDKDSSMLAAAMTRDIDREVEYFSDGCNKYQAAILRAILERRRRAVLEDKLSQLNSRFSGESKRLHADESQLLTAEMTAAGEPLPTYVLDRWQKELANRRQYLSFLLTLQDEVRTMRDKISSLCESVQMEMLNVKTLVSNKAAVPKEQVYPRFDALGSYWVRLFEEVTVLMARSNTFGALCAFRLSFNPTLLERYYDSDGQRELTILDAAQAEEKGWSSASIGEAMGGGGGGGAGTASVRDSDRDALAISVGGEGGDSVSGQHHQTTQHMGAGDGGAGSTGATLLTVHNAPDFMLLPLELQGYCPWTLCHAKGFLVPGKPALGVVRYDNMYFVCDNAVALDEFIKNPEFYLGDIRQRGVNHPEYIYLLRLEKWFPKASIARLLEQNDFDPRSTGGKPSTRDASTGTPVHFTESHFDVNYHWNEWELRRRALKVVALKGCITSTTQTDASHFRRDNETQVYLQREKASQTKRDKGVNPPVITQFVAGLRGKAADPKSVSRYIKAGDGAKDSSDVNGAGKPNARVITLKLDL